MSDYDLLREDARAHAPERKPETESGGQEATTAALAVQHGRPEALGAKGATHLQRAAGNAATSALVAQREDDPTLVHKVVGSGGGSTLDDGTRKSMESSLGADFSSVRVHTGGEAAAAAKSVQAQAFTVGDNIVLGAGKSTSDTRTLAHELTHVVQQRNGDVPGESIGNGLKVSDPGDWAERQAEATAEQVTSGGGASTHAGHDHGAGGVQREAAPAEEETEEPVAQSEAIQREEASDEKEEEEPLQGEFLQREEEAPEEEGDEV